MWQIILILFPPVDFLGSHICHAVTELQMKHLPHEQMPAALVLSKEAVAGHTKRATALNVQRVSPMSILNLWRN